MMQSIKQKAVNTAAKTIKQMGELELLGWPPFCIGTFYQTERPKTITVQDAYPVITNDKTF